MQPTRLLRTGVAAIALAVGANAHGGTYRAPGNISAPGGSSSSGSAPAATPQPSAPTSARPGGSLVPSGPRSVPGGPGGGPAIGTRAGTSAAEIGDDLTRWSYWWEFRKDTYLRLKERVHDTGVVRHSDEFFMGVGDRNGADTLKPTATQITSDVVPALHRALESTEQRDITSSCLIALAKIGAEEPRYHPLLPTLRARLVSHDQEIRETAALALGISQRSAAVPDLIALLSDDERGRKLCGRTEVDDRTRSFAGYGLGLVMAGNSNPAIARIALTALIEVLHDDSIRGMNVPIACVNAIGLLRPDPTDARSADVHRVALGALRDYYERDLGVGRQLVQAHVPAVVASLLRELADADLRQGWIEVLEREVRLAGETDSISGRNRVLAQSAALALGEIAAPNEPGAKDRWISESLFAAFASSKDAQISYFALIALGQIGGSDNRTMLLNTLRSGKKALEKPWAALALGLLERERRTRAGIGTRPDAEITEAIAFQLDSVRNPDALGAFAIALGLSGAIDQAPRLREALVANRHQDELAGYLCIGLGLMRDRSSIDLIRDIVTTSARRPQLLLQASVALGQLGDKLAARQLVDEMGDSDQNLAVLAALAFAVGQIGDRRSIAPLVEMLDDADRSDLARAFAAVSLGGVADKEEEPWNAKIGRQVNYRASVETLTDQTSGILDIL